MAAEPSSGMNYMQSSCKSWNWKLRKKGRGWQVSSVGKGFGTKLTMWLSPNPRTRRLEGENWCLKVVLCLPDMPCHACAGKDGGGAENAIRRLKIQKEGLKKLIFLSGTRHHPPGAPDSAWMRSRWTLFYLSWFSNGIMRTQRLWLLNAWALK